MEERLQELNLLEVVDIYNNLLEMQTYLEKQESLLTEKETNDD